MRKDKKSWPKYIKPDKPSLYSHFGDTTLETALSRSDLMLLPSNRFEALGGDRKGQFSIRINQQWRVCFEWPEEVDRPFNIEICDYHS